MRTYETMFIVNPDIVGDDHAALLEKFQNILKEQGAEMLKVEDWGTRKMAYPIRKFSRGNYILFYFQSPSEAIAEFERRLRIDDAILRFQTIVHEKEIAGLAGADEKEASPADDAEEAPEGAEEGADEAVEAD